MSTHLATFVLFLLLCACGGDPLSGGEEDTPPDTLAPPMDASLDLNGDLMGPQDDLSAIVAPSSWSEEVQVVPLVTEEILTGDTSTGSSLGGVWGYQQEAGCWLLPEASFYGGEGLLFAPSPVPPHQSKLTITLAPEPGVDLNLVVMTMDLSAFWVPPTVQLNACYASRSGGPGESEEKKVFTIDDVSNVLILVVSPESSAGGPFELSWLLE